MKPWHIAINGCELSERFATEEEANTFAASKRVGDTLLNAKLIAVFQKGTRRHEKAIEQQGPLTRAFWTIEMRELLNREGDEAATAIVADWLEEEACLQAAECFRGPQLAKWQEIIREVASASPGTAPNAGLFAFLNAHRKARSRDFTAENSRKVFGVDLSAKLLNPDLPPPPRDPNEPLRVIATRVAKDGVVAFVVLRGAAIPLQVRRRSDGATWQVRATPTKLAIPDQPEAVGLVLLYGSTNPAPIAIGDGLDPVG